METITNLTGISSVQIKNIIMLGFIGCIMLGIGEEYVTIAIGIAYPAFMSFLALETKRTDDDKQWLTYWIVFGAFNIIDHFADVITVFIPILPLLQSALPHLPECIQAHREPSWSTMPTSCQMWRSTSRRSRKLSKSSQKSLRRPDKLLRTLSTTWLRLLIDTEIWDIKTFSIS